MSAQSYVRVSHPVSQYATPAVIDSFIEKGRKEIKTYEELKKYPIGSLIAYLNLSGVLKKAGFLWKVTPDYFIYLAADFENKRRVWFNCVERMFVGDVYEVKSDIVSIVKTDKKPTKWPVVIDGIVVHYTNQPYQAVVARSAKKHKAAHKWLSIFKELRK